MASKARQAAVGALFDQIVRDGRVQYIGGAEIKVLIALATRSIDEAFDEEQILVCQMSREEIGELVGIHPGSAGRAVAELQNFSLIKSSPGKWGAPNEYEILTAGAAKDAQGQFKSEPAATTDAVSDSSSPVSSSDHTRHLAALRAIKPELVKMLTAVSGAMLFALNSSDPSNALRGEFTDFEGHLRKAVVFSEYFIGKFEELEAQE